MNRQRVRPYVRRRSGLHPRLLALVSAGCLVLVACQKQPSTAPVQATANREAPEPSSLLPDEYGGRGEPDHPTLTLPGDFGRRTGDLDEMVRARVIRAIVIVDPINFFYVSGRPHGIQFESLQEFERFANKKLNTGRLPVRVVFLPLRSDQLEAALTQGLGDFIALPIVITSDREQRLAFSIPIQKRVSQVVVTGSELDNITSFDNLVGHRIYVNPLTTYYENLHTLSASRVAAGKPPLDVGVGDQNLFDDDLIQMVNAGLLPATVTTNARADLWAQVLPNIKAHPELAVANEGEAAWAMRRNTPRLKQLIDEFLRDHAAGTTFGNTLLRRYLQNTKWIRNSISPQEMQKFIAYSEYFKKYAAEYNFDYLMIAAQGYEESQLDQSRISAAGAVGVMQVIPKFAAAPPINIPDVGNAADNIRAGTRILRNMADTHFNDPGINHLNKTLFTLASYDAGPARIAHLRDEAPVDGLDPNTWFGNVELKVAKEVGEETVIYVGNIYKYYVAYRLVAAERLRKGLPVSFK